MKQKLIKNESKDLSKNHLEIDIQNGGYGISPYFTIEELSHLSDQMKFSFKEYGQAELVKYIIKPIILLWKIHFGMYGRCEPEENEEFWYVKNIEFIKNSVFNGENKHFHKRRAPFKTREDAQRALEKLKELM